MAQTVSNSFKSNAQSRTRWVCAELRIAWGRSADNWPTDWGTQAYDETDYIERVVIDRQLEIDTTNGSGNGPVAQATIVLNNATRRFSPYDEEGSLYGLLSATTTTAGGQIVRYPRLRGTPVRLRMGFVDANAGREMVAMFTGVIDAPDDANGLTGANVTLTLHDRGGVLLDKRASSTLFENVPTGSWLQLLVSHFGGIATSGISRSFCVIPYAWLDDETLWREVQDAAAAEGGTALFDEAGVFRFYNAAWWATANHSLNAQADIALRYNTARMEIDSEAVASEVITEYQPRTMGGEQVLWRLSSGTLVIPPQGTTLDIKLQYPATRVLSPSVPGDWLPINAGGRDLSETVTVSFEDVHAQRCKLVFHNESGGTAFVPRMQVRGHALLGGPQEQTRIATGAVLNTQRVETVSGNAYMQTAAQATITGELLAYRKRAPRLTYRFVGVPALPWLQLGDRIAIADVPGITADRFAVITGLSFSWQPRTAFLMQVEAVDVAGLFEYDNYHVLGSDVYGNGRMFL